MKKINIGIIGFGTIGSGVVKALMARRSYLREKSCVDVCIRRICDKDLKTKRPVKVDRCMLTRSIAKVLHDPEIDIVVELMGGIMPARDVMLEALRHGKHVVTANKALLSEHGPEIFDLANKLGLCVGFEASVGGGIPIIRALKEGFIANRIDLIYGIINGTSNFLLSEMEGKGVDFKQALAEAQRMGYAEHNPELDINGGDSAHKLSVLALLGFGITAKPSDIYTEGITNIEKSDLAYAREMGYAIKLLAIAKRCGERFVDLRVHPTMLSATHLLANVGGVYNAIFVKGDLVGENLFYGEGAGASPTSSAVVGDIITIAKTMHGEGRIECCIGLKKDAGVLKAMRDVRTRYYVRFSTMDKTGVLAKISGILARYRISIASVSQKECREAGIVPIVMMTHEALERDMDKALSEIDRLGIIKKNSVRIRVEGN